MRPEVVYRGQEQEKHGPFHTPDFKVGERRRGRARPDHSGGVLSALLLLPDGYLILFFYCCGTIVNNTSVISDALG